MKRTVIVLLVSTMMVAACGGGDATAGLDLPDDPEAVILTVEDVGGFAPITFLLKRPPRLALTAKGSVIVQGPQIEIFPGPLMPNLQVGQLDEETLTFAFEEIVTLGFPEITEEVNDEASSNVADAPTTVVTFYDTKGPHVFSVYALGIGQSFTDTRVPILANLVSTVETTAYSLPASSYQADRIQVYAGIEEFAGDPQFANVLPWPPTLSFDEMTAMFQGWRCATFEGAEAATLLEVFGGANQTTRWEADGTEYTIIPRPLLPNEEACRVVTL
jgi:hypothetical protein